MFEDIRFNLNGINYEASWFDVEDEANVAEEIQTEELLLKASFLITHYNKKYHDLFAELIGNKNLDYQNMMRQVENLSNVVIYQPESVDSGEPFAFANYGLILSEKPKLTLLGFRHCEDYTLLSPQKKGLAYKFEQYKRRVESFNLKGLEKLIQKHDPDFPQIMRTESKEVELP